MAIVSWPQTQWRHFTLCIQIKSMYSKNACYNSPILARWRPGSSLCTASVSHSVSCRRSTMTKQLLVHMFWILCIGLVTALHRQETYWNSSTQANTHTNTHPFNGPFSRTTWVSRYQKGKTNLDLTEARDSEWQWNPLSAPRSRQITTPAPHHSVFYRPDALPATQPTASNHWRQHRLTTTIIIHALWG